MLSEAWLLLVSLTPTMVHLSAETVRNKPHLIANAAPLSVLYVVVFTATKTGRKRISQCGNSTVGCHEALRLPLAHII